MKHLIVFIILFVVFLGFIVLNMENKCDISFGFTTLKEIPVFLSALSSFMLGMVFAFPMVLLLGRGRKKSLPPSGKGAGKNAALDEIKKEESPYGID